MLQNVPFSIFSTVSGILIFVNEVQFVNAYSFIYFNDFPHSIFFKDVHPLNALSFIVITVSGNVMVSNEVQFSNIRAAIYSILLLKAILVNEVHPLNVYIPNVSIEFGNIICFKPVSANAQLPISVTFSGKSTFSNDAQYSIAFDSIFTTVSEITIFVKFFAFLTAIYGIFGIPSSNTTVSNPLSSRAPYFGKYAPRSVCISVTVFGIVSSFTPVFPCNMCSLIICRFLGNFNSFNPVSENA